MIKPELIDSIKYLFFNGGVVAYPTEAVYGLGCHPMNEAAVHRILELKQRPVAKGFILIASRWQQIADWLQPIPKERFEAILATWPGPHTWVFPANKKVPDWLRGEHDSLAVRITAHPIAAQLCDIVDCPWISTSANIHQQPAARNAEEVQTCFPNGIDLIIDAPTGNLAKPTTIQDALTGEILRS